MKCPYCGGEVPSRSMKCPYCGRENKEGIAFFEEVQEKIERNRLLRIFLRKEKTPELVQRMMTRILVILGVVNCLLFAFSFGVFLWADREVKKPIPEGSHVQAYFDTYKYEDYDNNYFAEEINKWMDMLEKGEKPTKDKAEWLARNAFYAVELHQTEDETENEEIRSLAQAFFNGYLGLPEEATLELMEEHASDWHSTNDADVQALGTAILDRLEEEMP